MSSGAQVVMSRLKVTRKIGEHNHWNRIKSREMGSPYEKSEFANNHAPTLSDKF